MFHRVLSYPLLLFHIVNLSNASTSQKSPLTINDDSWRISATNPRSRNWFRLVPQSSKHDEEFETEDGSEPKVPKSIFRRKKQSTNVPIEQEIKHDESSNPIKKSDETRQTYDRDENAKEMNSTKSMNSSMTMSQTNQDENEKENQNDQIELYSEESESQTESVNNRSSVDSRTQPNLRRPWFSLRSEKEPDKRGTTESIVTEDESIGDKVPSLAFNQNHSTIDQSKSGPKRLYLEPKDPADSKKSDESQKANDSNVTVTTENENDDISLENKNSAIHDTNSTFDKEVKKETNNESIDSKSPQNVQDVEKQNPPPPPPMLFSRQALPVGIPMQSQIPGNGVIIMGMDGRPQRGLPPGRQVSAPQSGAIISEAIATILSTVIRLWFLTSLTKWFADEETKGLRKPVQHFMWERLNDKYLLDRDALKAALATPPYNISERKWRRRIHRQGKQEQKLSRLKDQGGAKPMTAEENLMFQRTVIVVELSKAEKADMDIAQMEEIVSFIISEHRNKAFGVFNATAVDIEVILLIESPGGEVSEFGLGAAQVRRLTEEDGIQTTVCVDKIAASGGYMIASQASKIVAAPFAVVGSIGVIRQGLNFNKALQKYGILPMVLTAGDAKAPISTYGEITKGGLDIAQQNLNKIHDAFRELVVRGRPFLAETLDVIANGDIFLGSEAKNLQLVDVVMTSDQYILECVQAGDRVLRLHRLPPPARHRRIPSFHPLDFLRENGPRWLAEYDIPKIISKFVQASPVLHLALQLWHHRFD
jgi:signal peptide peptidase SppA